MLCAEIFLEGTFRSLVGSSQISTMLIGQDWVVVEVLLLGCRIGFLCCS